MTFPLARCLLLATSAILAGCESGTDSAPHTLVIQVQVLNSSGDPLSGAHVSVQAWPAIAGVLADSIAGRTGALGRITIEANDIEPNALDSLRVSTIAPGCYDLYQEAVRKPVELDGDADTLVFQFTADSLLPGATTVPGQACAFGVNPFWGAGSYRLGLIIDSVTAGALYGQWRLNYRFSSADDDGAFTGLISTDSLLLDLVHANPSGICTGLSLNVLLNPDGSWGTARTASSQGCVPEPAIFDFVKGDVFTYP